MKPFFLFFLLIFAAACSEDAPAPPPAPAVTYTDTAGHTSTLATYRAYLTTPPPSTAGQERRILVLRATLPDDSVLELLYYYVGTGFPTTIGAVRLDEFVQAANYPASANPSTSTGNGPYFGGSATGALTVDTVSPAVFSGTFAGPMVIGGGSVRLVFQRLPL